MRAILFVFIFFFEAITAHATKLSSYTPYEYDLRFTNPVCKEYPYEAPVESRSGETLHTKPRNAYCSLSDTADNEKQSETPIAKLIEWIRSPDTKEIFFTFLSYSNETVTTELCNAIERRGLKVTFVLDSDAILDVAKRLVACEGYLPDQNPKMYIRGSSEDIGYAHNKIFIVNPGAKDKMRIAFGSGNMTNGIILHHENWHFVTTSPKSYFAQAHLCVMKAEIDHAQSREAFSNFMQSCLTAIEAPPEEDIQMFFVPMNGAGTAAMQKITESLEWASTVKLAAHRFSNKTLVNNLSAGLTSGKFTARMIFDDDMFWAGTTKAKRPNMPFEFRNVLALEKAGAQVRYIQTNEKDRLLHHNKFIVFENGERAAAFMGAGNFTGDAFEKNLENFYYVTIPEVVTKMSRQHDYLYNELGTAEMNLPTAEAPVKNGSALAGP